MGGPAAAGLVDDSNQKDFSNIRHCPPPRCSSSLPNLYNMEAIKATFAQCKKEGRSALVAYFTCGYPTKDETADIMLGLEAGGAGTRPSTTLPCTPF